MPYADYALDIITGIVKNFPVKQKRPGMYTPEELTRVRKLMKGRSYLKFDK